MVYKRRSFIPFGLRKCKRCGGYKGFVKEKDLPPGHSWFKRGQPERKIRVRCLCEGVRCKVCGEKNIHAPCSSFYDVKTKSLWYVPGFIVWSLICKGCIKKLE